MELSLRNGAFIMQEPEPKSKSSLVFISLIMRDRDNMTHT